MPASPVSCFLSVDQENSKHRPSSTWELMALWNGFRKRWGCHQNIIGHHSWNLPHLYPYIVIVGSIQARTSSAVILDHLIPAWACRRYGKLEELVYIQDYFDRKNRDNAKPWKFLKIAHWLKRQICLLICRYLCQIRKTWQHHLN